MSQRDDLAAQLARIRRLIADLESECGRALNLREEARLTRLRAAEAREEIGRTRVLSERRRLALKKR